MSTFITGFIFAFAALLFPGLPAIGVDRALAAVNTDPPAATDAKLQELKKEMAIVMAEVEKIMAEEGLSTEEKQQKALEFIRNYRYGPNKDQYFIVNDLEGRMLMNPFLPDLEGKLVTNVKDQNGKLVFRDMIDTSLALGQGFVNYVWAPPDQENPEPKTSLVQLLKEWGWVLSTGFYMDTIEAYDIPVGPAYPPINDGNNASPP
jgi:methyl-accepting chemotaxis protein